MAEESLEYVLGAGGDEGVGKIMDREAVACTSCAEYIEHLEKHLEDEKARVIALGDIKASMDAAAARHQAQVEHERDCWKARAELAERVIFIVRQIRNGYGEMWRYGSLGEALAAYDAAKEKP